MSVSAKPAQVASLIIPLTGKNLLVPNACVAEIVANITTQPKNDTMPDWVMGIVHWRDLALPCLALGRLLGGETAAENTARIAIFNTLSDGYSKRFYGVAMTGIPRLARVTEQELILDEGECGEYEKLHVQLNGEACIVPNLEAIEKLLVNSGIQV